MSTDAVTPLRHRMIEDMNAPSSVRARRGATFTAASDLPRFLIAFPIRRRRRISAGSSCTWPRPA